MHIERHITATPRRDGACARTVPLRTGFRRSRSRLGPRPRRLPDINPLQDIFS